MLYGFTNDYETLLNRMNRIVNQYGAANFDQGASRMTVEVVLTDTGGASASVTALVLVDVLNINEPPSITGKWFISYCYNG